MFTRYKFERKDYTELSKKFRNYVYEFLYGDKTASYVLNKVNDITRIYYLSLNTESTPFGLIFFTIFLVLAVITILTSITFSIKYFQKSFSFLSTSYWYIIEIGLLCHICANFVDIGEVTINKCNLKLFLISIGFTFTFIPILIKLIINFPEENKLSVWVSKHKFIVLLGFVLIDLVIQFISSETLYKIQTIRSNNEKNYQECVFNGALSSISFYANVAVKVITALCISFLSFIEWNIQETRYDVRYLICAVYIDLMSIIVIIIFKQVASSNYVTNLVICKVLFLIFILSNFVLLIVIRIVSIFICNKGGDEINISQHKHKANSSSFTPQSSQRSARSTNLIGTQSNTGTQSVFSKILDYHNRTSVGNGLGSTSNSYASVALSRSKQQIAV